MIKIVSCSGELLTKKKKKELQAMTSKISTLITHFSRSISGKIKN